MRYEIGTVLNISALNRPVRAQVITEPVYDGVDLYSLGKDTDIPVRTLPNYHCFFLLSGKLNVFTRDKLSVKASREMTTGQGIIVPMDEAAGSTVLEDSVVVEAYLGRKLDNCSIQPMEPFTVRSLVAYQPGKAVQKILFVSGFMTLEAAAMDMRTEMKDQQAKGELILTGLEGEGIVIYLGKESTLHSGESFRIKNGTAYSLKTGDTQFKVSLLSRIE